MKALIKDENAIDKEVADIVKYHKRKHDDDEDDDDDEDLQLDQTRVRIQRGEEPKSQSLPRSHPPLRKPLKVKLHLKVLKLTAKTLNPDWFTEPLRPPTPDLEWNKHQYVLNRLKVDNLTQDILLGPAYNLLKGMCSSSIELEYHFQECFNALTDRIDWNNPIGDCYPFDLSKPLPLQGHLSHLTIDVDYFFNNDLEYLKSSDLERTYTTSIIKTKAARYEIKGIEDMVPTLWSPTKVGYDKDALKGIKHWGEGQGDLVDLHLNDIEDILLLAVQHKLFHLTENDIVEFIVALRMFTRSLVIKKCVEDLQLSVESYQKKLNITPPQQTFPKIEFKELYTPSHKPPGKVRDELHHRIRDFRLEYNKEMPRRKWIAIDRKRLELMVELIDKRCVKEGSFGILKDWLVLENSRWTTN
ncbi:hypothetical protein Tco_0758785 [Tanacetum coccineum]